MEYAVELENLSKSFGNQEVLKKISFKVPKGTVFGLLGPNGAGKTTAIRIMSCLMEPTGGDVRILGKSIHSNRKEIRRIVGCVTESPGIYNRLSVWDNLEFFAHCYELPKNERSLRIETLLKQFNLWKRKDDPAGSLSKGMKQKVSIICALLHDPEVLFFDEITANLDPISIREMKNQIKDWVNSGKTIIYCSHTLSEVDELCHQFAIIDGNVISLTTPQKFREEWSMYNVSMKLESNHSQAEMIFRNAPEIVAFEQDGGEYKLKVDNPDSNNYQLLKKLVSLNIPVTYIQKISVTLEDSYHALLKSDRGEI
ncbi:ABC transporter ATP-binding protein [Bacillus spongiae]|uniref:ABC transporter ATP-binding protein n=1 Tax=Bacillus spongiae TaxID=2683610 RepID=A0ABU8HBW6_9BACI